MLVTARIPVRETDRPFEELREQGIRLLPLNVPLVLAHLWYGGGVASKSR